MRIYLLIVAILLISASVSAIDYFRYVENYNKTAGNGVCNDANNTNMTDAVYASCPSDPLTYTYKWWNMSSQSSLGTITATNFSTVYHNIGVRTDDTYTIDYGFSTGGVTQCSDASIIWRNIITSNFPGATQTWRNASNVTPVDWTNTTNVCFRYVFTPVGAPDGGLLIEIDSLYAHVYYTLDASGLNATLNAPLWANNSQRLVQNSSFILNATVKCVASGGCGDVTAGARYNGTSNTEPDTSIPTVSGATVYIMIPSTQNQQNCGTLTNGDSCTVAWTYINASGTVNRQHLVDVNFSSSVVSNNDTINVYVNISNRPDINISVFWPTNNTLNISNTRNMWFLANITANHSEDVANVSLWTNQSGTWQRDKINNDGLVGYWQFSEGADTNARDHGPNKLNGTNIGGYSWCNCQSLLRPGLGQNIFYDGSSGYTNLGNSSILNPKNITIEAWFNISTYPSNGAYSGLVIRWNQGGTGGDNYFLALRGSAGTANLAGYVRTSGDQYGIEGTTPIIADPNIWHHAVLTYNKTFVSIYLDGQLEGSFPTDGGDLIPSIANTTIGRESDSIQPRFFNGNIDEVAIWNYSRSAEQIADDYKYRYLSFFNYSFPYDSNYLWNMEVCDQWNLCIMRNQTKPDSLTLNVSAIPDITLVLPNNNTLNSTSYSNIIEFNLTGAGYVWNSSLWTNQSGWDVRRTSRDNGLVGYWQFDEAGGTVVNDSSGNGNNGSLINSPVWNSSGKFGYGLTFDGALSYVGAPLVTTAKTNVTIEAWFKTTDPTREGQMIVYIGSDANSNGYGFGINKEGVTIGRIYLLRGAITWIDTGTAGAITDTNWHHGVLVVGSNSEFSFYLDGTLIYGPTAGSLNTPTLRTDIGRNDYPAARYFNGTIDEVAIYNRALNANETRREYTNRYNSYWNHTFGLDTDYLWNIKLCNRRGDCRYSLLNRTLNLSVNPGITLIGPSNASTNVTSDRNIYFTFNASMPSFISNLSYWNNESSWSIKRSTLENASGYWQFSEGTGTTTIDTSNNANNGVLANGPRWNLTAPYGYGLTFDAVDDVVNITNTASLQPLTKNWTVEFWMYNINASVGDFPQIIGSRPWTAALDKGWSIAYGNNVADNNYGKVGVHFADGSTGFDVNTNAQSASSTGMTPNIWQHWAVVFDRTNGHLKFYLNGALDADRTPSFPTGNINQADRIYVGREIGGSNNRRLNATLDEIAVYNYAKSADEIRNDYVYRYSSFVNYTFATLEDFVWNAQVCNFRGNCFFAPNNFTLKLRNIVPPEACAAFINASSVNYKNFTDYNITIRSPFNEEIVSSPLRVCWA